MAIITTYTDDDATTDDDKFLTSDSSGATKLTAAATLKAYVLGDGNVGTSALTDGAVTTAKLADDTVTSSKIVTGAVEPTNLSSTIIVSGTGSGSITLAAASKVLWFYSDNALGGTSSGHDYNSTFAVDGTVIMTLHRRTATTASGADDVDSTKFYVQSLASGSHTITVTALGTGTWVAIVTSQTA